MINDTEFDEKMREMMFAHLSERFIRLRKYMPKPSWWIDIDIDDQAIPELYSQTIRLTDIVRV